ncbi:MAG TPA: M56 family metallopeptidase [Acidobacteriaceae bacterium]|jgi:uncharacterized protein (TIGR03435 family)|nr:M56 family metallopeptidase [Acidobacteriaceae bacterium]
MNFHSLLLAPIVSALANHLWQSMIFAAATGLLALLLRKNHARVRYGLWLAASVKFLLPFSLLMAIGSHLGGLWSAPAIRANPGMYAAMDQVSQPFDRMAALNVPVSAAVQAEFHPQNLRLTLLMLAWLAGFLAVLGLRSTQWRGIAKILHAAKPLTEGREIEMLRRMERLVGLPKQIEMRLSQESLEPGIVGVFSPVLLWPEGISGHLDDAQLEAVLAHEICHVQRRDNLTSSLHLLVEAVFWIYPLVWWLEKPLIAERERACDEEVLRLGRQPQTYAESILKVCEFCVESPLTCVSGITGADLKKRIVRIMTASLGEGLSGGRKALLAAAAVVAIAVPIVLGQANGSSGKDLPRFEVATIKPINPGGPHLTGLTVYPGGRVVIPTVTLKSLVATAFHLDYWQVSGGDKWVDNTEYDIEAKAPTDIQWKMNPRFSWFNIEDERLREMLQALLIDRFQLKVHRETKTGDVYLLEKSGKSIPLSATKAFTAKEDPGDRASGENMGWAGRWVLYDVSMQYLADFASSFYLHKPVFDRTGLTGSFDYRPSEDDGMDLRKDGSDAIFHELIRALGLKLVPAKGPVETLVIDHAEPPSPN